MGETSDFADPTASIDIIVRHDTRMGATNVLDHPFLRSVDFLDDVPMVGLILGSAHPLHPASSR